MKVIPPELMMMILHGEQDFHFHAPILPDTTLTTRAAPIGVQPRSSGVTVVVKTETRDGDDQLLNEQYWTTFVRGGQTGEGAGEGAPPHAFDESLRDRDPDAQVSQTFDKDQTFRYAEASGDPMPIHLDDDLAKKIRAARNHHPRSVHDGVHVGRGRSSTRARRTRPVCSGSPFDSRRRSSPGQTITTSIFDLEPGHRRLCV